MGDVGAVNAVELAYPATFVKIVRVMLLRKTSARI
jgi:hypothetical protein